MSITALKPKGFTFVELVVAVAIFMIYAGGLTVAATGSHLTRLENAELAKAGLYFEEGWEAVRSMAGSDWSGITNGTHGLVSSGGSWSFSGSSDSYDDLTRVVTVTGVRRDGSGNIVMSGGESDPDSKKISIAVTWSPTPGKDLSIEGESYLTNYRNASEWPPASE